MKACKMRGKRLESYRSVRENLRTTEWLSLAGASGDHLIPASAQSKVNHNRLLRSVFIQTLKTLKDGATTQTVWANWSCCSITLIVKKCFLILNVLCPLSLFHSLNTTEKSLIPTSLFLSYQYRTRNIIHIHKIPLSFVFSRQSCPDSLRISS